MASTEHLIEARRRALPARGRASSSPAVDARRGGVPAADQRLERVAVAPERDDAARGRRPRARRSGGRMSAVWRNVSRKSVHSSGMSPKRTSGRPARAAAPAASRVGLKPRQRHARLDAALHVDERDLHVDGARQLGLRGLDLFELDDFARARRGRARMGRSDTQVIVRGRRLAGRADRQSQPQRISRISRMSVSLSRLEPATLAPAFATPQPPALPRSSSGRRC